MTQTNQSPEQASQRPNRSGWFWIFALTSPFLFLCLLSNCGGLLEPPLMVLFGWIGFLYRVVPQMTVDWAGVGMAVLCFAALTGVFEVLGRAFSGPVASGQHPTPAWKRSVLLSCAAGLVFWSGMTAVGFFQHTVRLVSEPPLLESSSLRVLAEETQSSNNLKQIGLAAQMHLDDKHGFPPGAILNPDGQPLHGWGTLLLPYLEQAPLFQKIRLDLPWTHPDNRPHFSVSIPQYSFLDEPIQKGLGMNLYAANVHLVNATPRTPRDVSDGLSQTLMFGETAGNHRAWGDPCNWRDPTLGINQSPDGFGHPSRKHALFALADGSVRLLGEDISPRVLKALATPAGGEVVRDEQW